MDFDVKVIAAIVQRSSEGLLLAIENFCQCEHVFDLRQVVDGVRKAALDCHARFERVTEHFSVHAVFKNRRVVRRFFRCLRRRCLLLGVSRPVLRFKDRIYVYNVDIDPRELDLLKMLIDLLVQIKLLVLASKCNLIQLSSQRARVIRFKVLNQMKDV